MPRPTLSHDSPLCQAAMEYLGTLREKPPRAWLTVENPRDFRLLVLRAAVLAMLPERLRTRHLPLRLFDNEFCGMAILTPPVGPLPGNFAAEPEELGLLLETLLSHRLEKDGERFRLVPDPDRKRQGAYFTPIGVVADVAARAVKEEGLSIEHLPTVCDPAMGAGTFLLGVARRLESLLRPGISSKREARNVRTLIASHLFGYDIDPLAVAVAEASLVLWVGDDTLDGVRLRQRLVLCDALLQNPSSHFDLVVGNPPWVAFAGRAAQPLAPALRKTLRDGFSSFAGYPTLHACFVELAARLCPRGRLALLVPSPLADLAGYRPMRHTLTRTHRVDPELVEYGQDAFEGVVQPCFCLLADAVTEPTASDAPFALTERTSRQAAARALAPPPALQALHSRGHFPPAAFREMGLQTTTLVTRSLLLRATTPTPPFDLPLLEGRDVAEFREGTSRLFLNADGELLKQANCRLRPAADFQKVAFVVRQTARTTIAALHDGRTFRNTLLAGFEVSPWSAAVLVGLLNSTLLRTIHLCAQRDARQRTFPQVKIGHLRALPAPEFDPVRARELEELVLSIHGQEPSQPQRAELNRLVYDWYGIPVEAAATVDAYFAAHST